MAKTSSYNQEFEDALRGQTPQNSAPCRPPANQSNAARLEEVKKLICGKLGDSMEAVSDPGTETPETGADGGSKENFFAQEDPNTCRSDTRQYEFSQDGCNVTIFSWGDDGSKQETVDVKLDPKWKLGTPEENTEYYNAQDYPQEYDNANLNECWPSTSRLMEGVENGTLDPADEESLKQLDQRPSSWQLTLASLDGMVGDSRGPCVLAIAKTIHHYGTDPARFLWETSLKVTGIMALAKVIQEHGPEILGVAAFCAAIVTGNPFLILLATEFADAVIEDKHLSLAIRITGGVSSFYSAWKSLAGTPVVFSLSDGLKLSVIGKLHAWGVICTLADFGLSDDLAEVCENTSKIETGLKLRGGAGGKPQDRRGGGRGKSPTKSDRGVKEENPY